MRNNAKRLFIFLIEMALLSGCCGAAHAVTPKVAAGVNHTVAVKNNGTLVAVGNDGSGQLGLGRPVFFSAPIQVFGLGPVRLLAGGVYHTVALKQDGTVWAWGDNEAGQLGDGTTINRSTPVQVKALTGVIAIAAGDGHTVAIKQDGTVWAWGYNDNGQLGDGTTISRSAPVKVGGLTGGAAVAAGVSYSVAMKQDGTVWAWGSNASGQLGDGTTINRSMPVQAKGLTGIAAIAAGEYHTVALKQGGTVWAWGDNTYGQLGNGTTISGTTPVQVTGLSGITAISAGLLHAVALKTDGTVWAWGSNRAGQLGDGTISNVRSTPTQAKGLTGITAIAAGGGHTVALKQEGTVWAWGMNTSGQLGDGTTTDRSSPVAIRKLTGIMAIAAGLLHTLALKQDGTVWAWGDSGFGQLGDGTITNHTTPAPVPGLTGAAAIAAGRSHTVALKQDGTVWAWGFNLNGQVGDGTVTNRSAPVQVAGLTGVIAIAAGENHALALKQNGTVWAWGANDSGQLADGSGATYRSTPVQVPGLTGVTAIAAGELHSIALKQGGVVWAWGDNTFGTLGDGTTISRTAPVQVAGMSGITAIAGGRVHTVALKQDGTVWAWGDNTIGELGDGTTSARTAPVKVAGLSGITSIAAGAHSVALKQDGTVYAWGYNGEGELGDGTVANRSTPVQANGLTEVIAIAAGGHHSIALNRDGTVYAWGENNFGAIGDGTYAQRLMPVLVVNETVDGFLDLIPDVPNTIPPDKIPPFLVVASGGITDTSATVSTTTKFNTGDTGKTGAVFVTARVPSGALGTALSTSGKLGALSAHLMGETSSFVLVQLTSSGWQAVVNGQLIPYASGVLGDQLAAQTILDGTDTANLKGAAFCLGYGTSAAEMTAAGRMRAVATIPDPTATDGTLADCIVVGSLGPNPFSFAARSDLLPSVPVVSEAITVTGITASLPISISGGEYSIDGGSFTSAAGTINNGQSVVVRTTTPAAYGATGSVTLTVGGLSASFTVTTKAAVPAVSLSPAGLNFAGQTQGTTSAAQAVTLANTGAATLSLSGMTVSGDFARSSTCPSSVAAGGNCTIAVSFTPTASGARTGSLSIISNASGSPHNVTLSGIGLATTLNLSLPLASGWNLLGNSLNLTIPVATLLGDPGTVISVWNWNPAQTQWRFYTPGLDAAALQSYAAGKGYGILSEIRPGEGYWVNAKGAVTLAAQSGAPVDLTAGQLPTGWNLVATGTELTPRQFNASLSATPPAAGTVPLNFTSLWAWDTSLGRWYFYAPSLEAQGGTALSDYISSKGHLDFITTGKELSPGTGFWVNR